MSRSDVTLKMTGPSPQAAALQAAAYAEGLRPVPRDPVERMAHWAARILDGDAETAGGSMDLDYSHDELAKAVREYLGVTS